jgi:hypothetical protein
MYTNPGPYTLALVPVTRRQRFVALARKQSHCTHGTTSRVKCTACAELELRSWRTRDSRQRHARQRHARQPTDSRPRYTSPAPERPHGGRGPAGPAATRRGARLLALRAGGQRQRPRCQSGAAPGRSSVRKEGHSRPAEGKGARSGEPSHAKVARSAAAHLAIQRYRLLLVRGARHA